MSDELESVGALSTATLAAAALEGAHGHNGHDGHGGHAHGNCANCQAPLTGPFCRMCGQHAHIHRSLLHLAEELLHGVFHFEAKGWRTIPLLIFKPGVLTRRYIEGQRKTYVSPLALFLFMMFLMFFVASLGGDKQHEPVTTADAIAAIQVDIADEATELADAKTAVGKANTALDAARKQGRDVAELQEDLNDAMKEQKSAETDLQKLDDRAAKLMATAKAASATTGSAATNAVTAAAAKPDTAAAPVDSATGEIDAKNGKTNWLSKLAGKLKDKLHSRVPWLNETLTHTVNNPELAIYKLKNTTYKYSFMLVPISLPFLWLMFFWRRGVAMFDHAIFVLYSLCFMSLLFDAITLAGMVNWNLLAALLLVFVPPAHMFVQLRGTYDLGVFSTLWRTVALTIVASIVLSLFFVMVLALSMH